jgi:Tol biopolymer transport system component
MASEPATTNDELNNWFAHFSPDGKRIRVHQLRQGRRAATTPTTSRSTAADADRRRAAAVIAYVYGGQGTINVPSWSPDGKSSPSSATTT